MSYELQYWNEDSKSWWILAGSDSLSEVRKHWPTLGLDMLTAGLPVRIVRMVPKTWIVHEVIEYHEPVDERKKI